MLRGKPAERPSCCVTQWWWTHDDRCVIMHVLAGANMHVAQWTGGDNGVVGRWQVARV
jgi:hypothetical protein